MFYITISRVVNLRLSFNMLVFIGVKKGQVLKIFKNFFFFFLKIYYL